MSATGFERRRRLQDEAMEVQADKAAKESRDERGATKADDDAYLAKEVAKPAKVKKKKAKK